jgi:hypothetical protein
MREEPTRRQVAEVLQALEDGQMSREEAARWASTFFYADAVPIEDPRVFETLYRMVGAAIVDEEESEGGGGGGGSAGTYLYGPADFALWARDLLFP